MIRHLAKPRKTIEDYMHLPDEARAELIDGELLMSPSPKFRHQQIVTRMGAILQQHVLNNNLGELVVAPMDVYLPSGDVVQPDLVFVSKGNSGIIQDWIRGAPDVVIEVLSPGAAERDRFIKRDLYARNGIPEYWIVDGESRTIEVFRLKGKAYVPSGYLEPEDTVSSVQLPGLEFCVGDVL